MNYDEYNSPLNIWKYYSTIRKKNYVNSYITTLTAVYLILENKIPIGEIRKYIYWYLDRINTSDHNRITGTIYDFEITLDGKEKPLRIYDSADGYAGLFLTLSTLYCIRKQDYSLIKNYIDKYLDIAYLIVHLKNSKGLTISDPQNHQNYLMNNLEAYGGLLSIIYALKKINHNDFNYYYAHVISFNRDIWQNFYDFKTGYFYWAITDKTYHQINPDNIYPDVYSQIFPVAYGLVYNKSEIRNRLINFISEKLDPLKLPKEQYFMYRSMYLLEKNFAYISQKFLPEL
ncbi:hypothetical protein [Persephonella sp.]